MDGRQFGLTQSGSLSWAADRGCFSCRAVSILRETRTRRAPRMPEPPARARLRVRETPMAFFGCLRRGTPRYRG